MLFQDYSFDTGVPSSDWSFELPILHVGCRVPAGVGLPEGRISGSFIGILLFEERSSWGIRALRLNII